MNIGIFSFKDIDVYQAVLDLANYYEGDEELVLLLPIIKPLPTFYNSVIRAAQDTGTQVKCFFVNRDHDIEHLKKYSEDLVLTDNPVKEVLRQLTIEDSVGIVWEDTEQCHYILHAVEDLALDIWDITDGMETIDFEDFDYSMDPDQLHEELMQAMGKVVDLMVAFVAETVMDSLSEAVYEHLKNNEDPFDDKE